MRTTLPVHPLDLEPFLIGSDADRVEFARRLDEACRDSGFLVVTGHGVSCTACDTALDAFAAFFDRPDAEKRRVVVADPSANRGYSALGREGLAYSRGDETPSDLFEAFNVGSEDTIGAYYDAYRSFYAPNVWPEEPAGCAIPGSNTGGASTRSPNHCSGRWPSRSTSRRPGSSNGANMPS